MVCFEFFENLEMIEALVGDENPEGDEVDLDDLGDEVLGDDEAHENGN